MKEILESPWQGTASAGARVPSKRVEWRIRWGNMPLALMLFSLASTCLADNRSPSRTVVFSNATGHYYARSIPKSVDDDTAGVTKVYRSDKDKLLCEYPWYSRQLWLFFDGNSLIVVRRGTAHRRSAAPEDEFEFGFYKDGKLLKAYSVADIAKRKENIVYMPGYYYITCRARGIARGTDANYFEITTADGRDLKFDLSTGQLLGDMRQGGERNETKG